MYKFCISRIERLIALVLRSRSKSLAKRTQIDTARLRPPYLSRIHIRLERSIRTEDHNEWALDIITRYSSATFSYRILPYGKNNCCSLVARLPLPRFIDVSSISHYPNRNGGNNNRTSILNRARIILVSPSLIARSRLAALRFPPSLSPLSSMNYRGCF